ncbi:aminoglycoside phosphotransferase family protein [Candidatus Saccharibacteria bacterium]|nr:aminoglycoside phosphotransferase family protein [Candidatus Saccharibacteria bacterium]
MNPENALKTLLEEYPFLDKTATKIIKQFVSADGRTYNTFLVESAPPCTKFIAKSFVHDSETIKREWVALRMLQEKGAHAPRLLVSDHEPQNFLLLEYIDGIPASRAVKQGNHSVSEIFRSIGETAGITNSIELDTFGNILEPSGQSWKGLILEKLDKKLETVRHIFDEPFFAKLIQALEETKHVLDEETKDKPMLVHHDFYLENFLIKENGDVILIDYGIAFGGRPLFDLAKFYIWELTRFPEQKETFLQAYGKSVPLPANLSEVMCFYVLYECLGMIVYFDKIGANEAKNEAIETLKDAVNKKGIITELLQ